ncbi:MAG: DNA/RNA non-specific endonuclease [Sphingobacteriales bacterium JAD_PAG50586_3]|nr:MAG: DNA/RNA non-specific endonuclease [Sphingobacteriales bacterium JAD_PAG50586_3]
MLLIVLFAPATAPVQQAASKITYPPTRDANLALGNPSAANKTDKDNYLVEREQYTLSYNNSRGGANWVSWHLSNAWKGNAARSKEFYPDKTLPQNFYRATSNDYTNSGFDRGHLCPSDDRDGNVTDNEATFLMDNIIPQAPKNNQVTWKALEDYSRQLAAGGNELYIMAGAYGKGGINKNGDKKSTIAKGKITVPSNVWKIIVVLPNGPNDIKRINTSTRVIAVDMPNVQSVTSQPWYHYKTTVDAIEEKTNLDFLSAVPKPIQAVIESRK